MQHSSTASSCEEVSDPSTGIPAWSAADSLHGATTLGWAWLGKHGQTTEFKGDQRSNPK